MNKLTNSIDGSVRPHRSDASLKLGVIINNVLLDGLRLLLLHHDARFGRHDCAFKRVPDKNVAGTFLM